ncbi:MAG: hypothetical protein U9R36_03945 [Elusimicrobiota bacterium]|nr:hypothetical protein [Elusimicrobiota bacterium]
MLIIYALLLLALSLIAELTTTYVDEFLGFLVHAADFVIRIIIGIGFLKIFLKFIDNQKPRYSDLFAYHRLFFKYLGGNILYFLIVFGETILLVVPGFVFAVKFYFYSYNIVDKGLGPVEALKRSSVLTAGVKWILFFFLIILTGINLLGLLAFGAGLFFTVPLSALATVYVYRRLEECEASQILSRTLPGEQPESREPGLYG